ncbi:MAG: carboxypeptidase-like regulatory domain-containing protein, partial [Balneolaceae bacterium]|nr:carboxypeptidase-like regulatory domain-containing protein [Balneolaceae bacterium]
LQFINQNLENWGFCKGLYYIMNAKELGLWCIKLLAIFLLLLPLCSCALKLTAHHTPEVRGTVIDLGSMSPVSGVSVGFLEFDNQTTTDADGEFHLTAISESKYFQLMLPASHVRFTPVMVIQNEDTVAYGWATSHFHTGSTTPQSEIVILLPKTDPESDLNLSSDSQLNYIVQLSRQIEAMEDKTALIDGISPNYDRLRDSIEPLYTILYENNSDSEIVSSEVLKPFEELYEIIP